jgi:hypothetical protein
MSQSWDHSCLDGNLIPLPCHQPKNASEPTPKQCASALYRVGQRGITGKKLINSFIHNKKKIMFI